jgi:protein-tyrosine phosphatase
LNADPARADRYTQQRRLPLRGAVNCRDLGGYVTDDDRQVRWGILYRSDSLAELSDDDLEMLAATGLRTVCDLRGESERLHKPNRRLPSAVVLHEIGFMPHRGDELLARTREGRITVTDIELEVREVYRRFVIDQTASYARLLTLIEEPALPLLFHCTSGRDRTGFAAAIVLLALGVPRETVASDYALSNRYRRDLSFQIGSGVDLAVLGALTQAHPDYLATAFRTIDEHWGSDRAYLRDALGLTPQRRSELQDLLLEPAGAARGSAGQAGTA